MSNNKSRSLIAILVIVLILFIDQILKIWVKTHMALYDMITITKWFKIYFVENNGMAFGMEVIQKTFLSLFRIVAIVFIAIYLVKIIKKKYAIGFIICIALILSGAFGNIIDCVFYGKIFSASFQGHIAEFTSFGSGYATWLHGQVVDMLYFPLIHGTFPSWMPVWGGEKFIFFSPIFNFADSAITVGVILLLLFYRKTLSRSLESRSSQKS